MHMSCIFSRRVPVYFCRQTVFYTQTGQKRLSSVNNLFKIFISCKYWPFFIYIIVVLLVLAALCNCFFVSLLIDIAMMLASGIHPFLPDFILLYSQVPKSPVLSLNELYRCPYSFVMSCAYCLCYFSLCLFSNADGVQIILSS